MSTVDCARVHVFDTAVYMAGYRLEELPLAGWATKAPAAWLS